MHFKRLLLLSVVVAGGVFAASPDANITYSLSGTLAPIENGGPDCLGLDTKTASASVTHLISGALSASTATAHCRSGRK